MVRMVGFGAGRLSSPGGGVVFRCFHTGETVFVPDQLRGEFPVEAFDVEVPSPDARQICREFDHPVRMFFDCGRIFRRRLAVLQSPHQFEYIDAGLLLQLVQLVFGGFIARRRLIFRIPKRDAGRRSAASRRRRRRSFSSRRAWKRGSIRICRTVCAFDRLLPRCRTHGRDRRRGA